MNTHPDLVKATDFIWRTARLLDRQRFAFLFLDGSSDTALGALRPYQNADGGFGNALEPDLRAPMSQPVPTWTALCILDEIDAFADPIVPLICTYLQSITTPEGGVPFVLPSAHAYPSAPWWQSAEPPADSLNPTAAIAALLYKHGIAHPWLSAATNYCWRQIEAMDQSDPYEMRAVLPFLEYVPDRERAERTFARIGPMILEQGLVALDPTASGEDEVHTPLNFAPRPQSLARRLFSDAIMQAHLETLAAAQQEDGGWQFNWLAWNAATTVEWRGIVTIEALVTLRAYGYLP